MVEVKDVNGCVWLMSNTSDILEAVVLAKSNGMQDIHAVYISQIAEVYKFYEPHPLLKWFKVSFKDNMNRLVHSRILLQCFNKNEAYARINIILLSGYDFSIKDIVESNIKKVF